MSKKPTTVTKGVPTRITVTSRMSIKLGDSFYTFEAELEKELPHYGEPIILSQEWEEAWGEVHNQVDKQAQDVIAMSKQK